MSEGFEGTYSKPADRRMEAEWTAEGCLPPDETQVRQWQAKEMLRKFAEEVNEGNVPESERAKIATNAVYQHSIGKINDDVFAAVLEAVQVDENGDLLRPEGDPIVANTNLSDV